MLAICYTKWHILLYLSEVKSQSLKFTAVLKRKSWTNIANNSLKKKMDPLYHHPTLSAQLV